MRGVLRDWRWDMKKMKKWLYLALTLVCTVASFCILPSCKKERKVSTRYEITAEYSPENRTLTGTAKVTFENCGDSEISVLKFQTYPNAYRKDALYRPVSTAYADSAYYAGESFGEMSISSVHGSKNWEMMGEDKNILYVFLERALYPGDKVVLDIGFLTKLAQVNHRTGVTAHTVNLGNFYPVLCGFKNGGFYECVYYSDGDPFYSDCADYKLRLTLPKEYTVAHTGILTSEEMLESKKVYTMYATNVRDFALTLCKKYREERAWVGDTEIVYYYYADKKPSESLAAAKEAFSYYQKTFGEYPYARYTLAETGLCFDGMEYPTLVMISDALSGAERARAIAHETAHQWWYGVVGSDQTQNAWQDEGLAEYSAICFFEEYEKYGFKREDMVAAAIREYRSYYDVYGSVLGRSDTSMTRDLASYISGYEYQCLAYDKAVVMLDTLRKSVGDRKFFAALKRYYMEGMYAMNGVGELIGAFERTGLDVAGFFDGFLTGKAIL